MLIFLWQQATAPAPAPIIDLGVPYEEQPVTKKRHRGHGTTTLERVVGFGTGRIRRTSIAHPLIVTALDARGQGRRRTRGAGSHNLTAALADGTGRRRISGRGSLELVLMRSVDRDALIALASAE
jgi:hypothetical protein